MRSVWKWGILGVLLGGCARGGGSGSYVASASGYGYDVPVLEIDKNLVGVWRDEKRNRTYSIAPNGRIDATKTDGTQEMILPLVINPGRLEYKIMFSDTQGKQALILMTDPKTVVFTQRDLDANRSYWEPVTILKRVETKASKP